MEIVNLNIIKSSSNISEIKGVDISMKYDDIDMSCDDTEWDIVEYYEGCLNSEPIRRKYTPENERRLSL